MEKIKNIIFDLGGVVINLRRERAVEELTRLGLKEADEMLGLYRQEEPFLSLEKGDVTSAEFFDEIRRRVGVPVPDTEIEKAFDAFLVDLPVERLQALRRLREEGFTVIGLSNTNPVMYPGWIKRAFSQEGLRVNDYFDGIVLSYEEGMCKPDPELFRTLLRRYKLNPAETIILDDSQKNCEAAESVGMQSACVGTGSDNDMIAIVKEIERCNPNP